MIYAYRYLEHHPIEQFHENITYFFERLFALNPHKFDANLLLRADFIPLVQASPTTLLTRLSAITYAYHHALDNNERLLVQDAFKSNNDIEAICLCGCIPYKYDDIPAGIRVELKAFFDPLWKKYPQNDEIEAAYGTVKSHFDAFVNSTHQQALICPFCGIMTLQPSEGKYRDAYDHFIPKNLYPFVSVNFQNLVPACHICNSPAKHDTDVPFNLDGSRRQMTYPFTDQVPFLVEAHITYQIGYDSSSETLLNQTKTMWNVTVTKSGNITSEMEGWDAVYNIRQRFKDHIGQYERVWWKDVVKKYKQNRHLAFENFKEIILDDYDDVTVKPMAIVCKAYYNHLFNIPDIESLLMQTL